MIIAVNPLITTTTLRFSLTLNDQIENSDCVCVVCIHYPISCLKTSLNKVCQTNYERYRLFGYMGIPLDLGPNKDGYRQSLCRYRLYQSCFCKELPRGATNLKASPTSTYKKGTLKFAGTGLDFAMDFTVVQQAIAIAKKSGTKVLLSVGGSSYQYQLSEPYASKLLATNSVVRLSEPD